MFVKVTVPVPADDGFNDEQNALKEPSNTRSVDGLFVELFVELFDELFELFNKTAIIIEMIITQTITHNDIPLFINIYC